MLNNTSGLKLMKLLKSVIRLPIEQVIFTILAM